MKIQRLTDRDLPYIVQLQSLVIEDIKDPSLYYPLSPAEIRDMLGDWGLSLGVYSDSQLIAYAAVRFPGSQPDNLGLDSGLGKEELARVAHIEAGLVHPGFRGKNLQKLLYAEAIRQTRSLGRFRYLYSTVACHNNPALVNSLNLGLVISGLKPKYDGYPRYILYQDWDQPIKRDQSLLIKVKSDDLERQIALLDRGWLGFAWEGTDKGVCSVIFATKVELITQLS